MKNFPLYADMFLLRAEQEDAPEAVEAVKEIAETFLESGEEIPEGWIFRCVYDFAGTAYPGLWTHTLNGLWQEWCGNPDLSRMPIIKKRPAYLEELEKLCVIRA